MDKQEGILEFVKGYGLIIMVCLMAVTFLLGLWHSTKEILVELTTTIREAVLAAR